MIYLLLGDNSFARGEHQNRLERAFLKQTPQAIIERHDADRLEPTQLVDLLHGGSLFASQRLIELNQPSLQTEIAQQLLQLLAKPLEDVELIIIEHQLDKRTTFYKTLLKLVTVLECPTLERFAAPGWVQQFAEISGGKIDRSTAGLLVERLGLDQAQLAQEIKKLIDYAPQITAQQVELLTPVTIQTSVFQLIEALTNNRTDTMMALFDELEQARTDVFQLVNLLFWQLNILAVVSTAGAASEVEIVKRFGFSPYPVQKARAALQHLSASRVKQMVKELALLDVRLKSETSNPWRLAEATLLKC